MTWQIALRARLVAAPAVNNAVSGRIYWVDRPQASALPSITLQAVNDERPQHMTGMQGFRSPRCQVDVWAASYKDATDIAEAVIAAVLPRAVVNGIRFDRADVDAVRDLGERTETQFIHRKSIDFIIHHSPA